MASTNEQIKRIETESRRQNQSVSGEALAAYRRSANSCRNAHCSKRSVRLHQPMTMRRLLLDLLAAERPSAATKDEEMRNDNEIPANRRVTDEQIERARSIDLVQFLQRSRPES